MTTYPASYCPDCGAELGTRTVDRRDRGWCAACARVVWHTAVPSAGVAVVGEEGVLLGRRSIEPGTGTWSVPGGHLEAEEPPAAGAARELAEETGLRVAPEDLTLLDTFHSETGEGKYVVSTGFVVRRAATEGTARPGRETAEVGWFTPDSVGEVGELFLSPHAERLARAWAWFQAGAEDSTSSFQTR